ncbi:hypothetical protein T12_616 [Trichinella patagoniensis]|uniref:Uncharacterized protein n=1 Tax=Trichinella patagoniensis TaxID=990121 RepID=A0A0V0Z842_9BILA|nr:hypothetical protein T12_616 [Trichinella patagoniensis]
MTEKHVYAALMMVIKFGHNIDGDVLYRAITNDSFCLYDSLMPIRQAQHDRRNKEYWYSLIMHHR